MLPSIVDYAKKGNETITFSIDDATSILRSESVASNSELKIWQPDLMDKDDLEKLIEFNIGKRMKFMNIPDGKIPFSENVILRLPKNGSYQEREFSRIWAVTIHHTVSWNPYIGSYSNVENIAQYHVSKGWKGIGYHYLIDPNGLVFITNYIKSISYHAGESNDYSVGIALAGDFREESPDISQILAARRLVKFLRGWLPKSLAIIPHKRMWGSATACPGNEIEIWMDQIAGIREVL